MDWEQVVNKIKPYIMKIETPKWYGTGFLCLYNQDKSICGIATAQHVVEHADEWQQPIRIRHNQTGEVRLLKGGDRIIYKDDKTDSAVVIFPKGAFPFPVELIKLHPTGSPISIGIEVCWLGFPQIQSNTLCFFSGNISAWQENRKAYLIDGVAISGVSGGPVLYGTETEGVQIVGTISAYTASRVYGEALPGLSIAQDVSHFHDVINRVRSIDEATKKELEDEVKKARQELEETKQSNGAKQPSSTVKPIEDKTQPS